MNAQRIAFRTLGTAGLASFVLADISWRLQVHEAWWIWGGLPINAGVLLYFLWRK